MEASDRLANKVRILHCERFRQEDNFFAAAQRQGFFVRRPYPLSERTLEPDHDLAACLIGLHQPVGRLDLLEAENLGRLGLVGAGGDAIDDVLEGDFRPRYLIERDLRTKRLLPITGKHFRGGEAGLVAARLRNAPHGPIANRLWQYIADQTARLVRLLESLN